MTLVNYRLNLSIDYAVRDDDYFEVVGVVSAMNPCCVDRPVLIVKGYNCSYYAQCACGRCATSKQPTIAKAMKNWSKMLANSAKSLEPVEVDEDGQVPIPF